MWSGRLPIALFLGLLTFGAAQGQSREPAFGSSDEAKSLLKRFRSHLHEEVRGAFSDDELARLILYPTPELLQRYQGSSKPDDPFADLRQTLTQVSPRHLYAEGQRQGFGELDASNAEAETAPVTLVLVPGIMTEFADVIPFEELVRAPSLFKAAWQERLKTLPPELRSMKQYSLHHFADVDVPTSELFEVGSIDDEAGSRELVRYIYLRPKLGSLETLGSLDSKMASYRRRLELLFAILPEASPVYLLGYSQGANVALHLMAQLGETSQAQRPAWMQRLRGVVSLGGALFGSELADAVKTPGELGYEVVSLLENFAANLRDNYRHEIEIPAVMAHNSWLWSLTFERLRQLITSYKRPASPGDREPRIQQEAALAKLMQASIESMQRLWHLGMAPWQYFPNVKRFKIVISKALEGARAMASDERLAWWRQHRLPSEFSYYAVSGVMADSFQEEAEANPLLGSSWYGPQTLDYALLREGFYEIRRRSGLDLNDSQVALHQAMFWPELHVAQNPTQEPYRAFNLAILGTHHWGFAINGVLTSHQRFANPFPRRAFLKALGLTLAASSQAEALPQPHLRSGT